MTPWQTLGVAPDVSVADVRRRYAALIKEFRPETHPQEFARIREAYEAVLPIARRREAAAAEVAMVEAAAEGLAEPVPPPADPSPPEPVAAPPDFAHAPAATIEVPLAAAPSDDDGQAAGPGLAERFHRFHALAGGAAGTRDEAWLPELRALLQARAGASLDDSQALEFALLRWFIENEQPPLTLLFEAGRAFDWHLHPARVSSWLSPWALRQMEARLALSRDLVWARHFSGNAWLRRLHSAANPMTLVASRPATLAALGWAERWRHGCEDAGVPALDQAQNPRTLRRLQGRELLSTDLLMGLLFASTETGLADVADAATWAAIGTAVALGLRLALLWLRPAPGRWRLPAPVARLVTTHPRAGLGLVAGLAVLGLYVAGLGERTDAGPWVGAALLVAPAALLGLLAIWHGLGWLERGVAELGAWREAVDRLEFDGFLHRRTPPDAAAPFGTRWTLRERLKAIPAALRLQRVEVATRQRPARPPLFTRRRFAWRHTRRSRMVWIALWVLFAILRGIHAFGN